MRYLLDTHILSESMRARPAQQVLDWLNDRLPQQCFVSVLTLGDIRNGATAHPDEARRKKLTDWLENTLSPWFDGRTFDIDTEVADRWGRLRAEADRPLAIVDSLLAATALTHGLTLVSRDIGFETIPGLQSFNPWTMN